MHFGSHESHFLAFKLKSLQQNVTELQNARVNGTLKERQNARESFLRGFEKMQMLNYFYFISLVVQQESAADHSSRLFTTWRHLVRVHLHVRFSNALWQSINLYRPWRRTAHSTILHSDAV